MTKRLFSRLLAVLILTMALMSQMPSATGHSGIEQSQPPVTNSATTPQPPGPCSPGGVCDRQYQSCRASGTPESTCRARRLACWEYWGCA